MQFDKVITVEIIFFMFQHHLIVYFNDNLKYTPKGDCFTLTNHTITFPSSKNINVFLTNAF